MNKRLELYVLSYHNMIQPIPRSDKIGLKSVTSDDVLFRFGLFNRRTLTNETFANRMHGFSVNVSRPWIGYNLYLYDNDSKETKKI